MAEISPTMRGMSRVECLPGESMYGKATISVAPAATHAAKPSAMLGAASEKSKEHAVAEGIAIAREMLERVRGSVQGAQVSAPFGKVELAVRVFES